MEKASDNLGDMMRLFEPHDDPSAVRPGTVLVSEPFGDDEFFGRSVVLMLEHDSRGSLGLIVNKPMSDLPADIAGGGVRVAVGGPVEPAVAMVLCAEPPAGAETRALMPGLHWVAGGEGQPRPFALDELGRGVIYLGYCGWSAGQLADEMRRAQWLVGRATAAQVLAGRPGLWEAALLARGPQFRAWINVPHNPAMN